MEQVFQRRHGAGASTKPLDSSEGGPTLQKRARDYGEELKGLSSEEDDGRSEESTPALKRRKITGDTDPDGGGKSVSEGLDDGEIVEPRLPSGIAQHVTAERHHQPNSTSQAAGTSDSPISVLSEDEETATNSGAEKVLRQNQHINGKENQDDGSSIIHRGKRASSAAGPAKSSVGASHRAAETTGEPEKPPTNEEKKRARSRNPVFSFEAGKESWNFPTTAPAIVVPTGISEEDDAWKTILKDWISHLLEANGEAANRLNFKVVRAGWPLYFSKKMGFLRGKNKETVSIRTVAQSFMTSLDKDVIGNLISGARAARANMDSQAPSQAPDNPSEELALQEKYFRGADDPSKHCLSCSGIGHTSRACPELKCRFCEERHNSIGCPTRQRCGKCRQLGHIADGCKEKLSLAPDELGGCAFCDGNHQDQDCTEIWRSFKPSELNTKKVKSIPAFCYECGGQNHYGPECPSRDKSGSVSDSTTWSTTNRNAYIDPESEDVAIAWANVDPDQVLGQEFHILGRAVRKTHTYFVSSDDSDEDFTLRMPKKKGQSRGANGNSRGRGRSDANNSWQQSLPYGRHPPAAENGPAGLPQSTPNTTLPPRPETFTGGRPRGGGNSGSNSRGGYRGRGRGRGRGTGRGK